VAVTLAASIRLESEAVSAELSFRSSESRMILICLSVLRDTEFNPEFEVEVSETDPAFRVSPAVNVGREIFVVLCACVYVWHISKQSAASIIFFIITPKV
jgi:hypothetical protein